MCRPVGLNLHLGRDLRDFYLELRPPAWHSRDPLTLMRMTMCGTSFGTAVARSGRVRSIAGLCAVWAAVSPVWRLPWVGTRCRLSLEVVVRCVRLDNDTNCPKPYRVRPVKAGNGNDFTCQQLN